MKDGNIGRKDCINCTMSSDSSKHHAQIQKNQYTLCRHYIPIKTNKSIKKSFRTISITQRLVKACFAVDTVKIHAQVGNTKNTRELSQ